MKRKSNKCIMLTKAEISKLKREITEEAFTKSVVLMLAYIMEEPGIDCDEDKIVEIFEGVERYAEYIENHEITLKKVCEIIKEYTGLDIVWG